jgi:hypothetical protein
VIELAPPALYVWSLGPAVWLSRRVFTEDGMRPAVRTIYAPLQWFASIAPEPVGDALNWYAVLWLHW